MSEAPENAYQSNLEALVHARTEQLRSAVLDLERSYDITLEVLGKALGLKDAPTLAHSRRVTAFSISLARALGLPREQIAILGRAAFLHDIGMLGVPDAILNKTSKLTPDEWAIVKGHCWHGFQLVQMIPHLHEAAEIVYAHQERFDGTGYPRGLRGEEIPIAARIIAVTDSLDAITFDRPYRAARVLGTAKEEIQRCAGKQFDPWVVEVLLKMPDHLWEDLAKEVASAD